MIKKIISPKFVCTLFLLFTIVFLLGSPFVNTLYERSWIHFIIIWLVFYPSILFFALISVYNLIREIRCNNKLNIVLSFIPLIFIILFFTIFFIKNW